MQNKSAQTLLGESKNEVVKNWIGTFESIHVPCSPFDQIIKQYNYLNANVIRMSVREKKEDERYHHISLMRK